MWAELKSKVQNPKPEIILLLICAVAFALRLGPLFDNRFHPDEALFSTWALKIAHGENLLLTGVPVDKPPLLIYLTALSFFVFGQSELAARVPNLDRQCDQCAVVVSISAESHSRPALA